MTFSDDDLPSEDELPAEEDDHDYYEPLIQAHPDGGYAFAMPPHLGEILISLAQQLDEELESDSPDLARLYPTAYNDDPDMDAGYQILARGQLVDQRRAAIQVLRTTARNSLLSEDELNAWMRIVNDLRLVIGTRLDVAEGDYEIDENDPDAPLHGIYQVLGFVLSDFVDALTGSLPIKPD